MGYIEEIFYIFTAFMIAYFIFRHYDVLKKIAYPSVIDKDFSSCYILKYPQYAEFHNKNNFYTIDGQNCTLGLNATKKFKYSLILI